jgi:hypothetical protein
MASAGCRGLLVPLEYLPDGPNDSGLIRLSDYGSSEVEPQQLYSLEVLEKCSTTMNGDAGWVLGTVTTAELS